MSSVLDEIAAAEVADKEQVAERFAALVVQVSDDENSVDPAQVAAELKAIGKTSGDLYNAVQARNNRKHLCNQMAAGPILAAEIDATNKKIQQADAALQAAKDLHAETVQPLMWRRQELSDAQRAAARAERELREGAPDEISDRLKFVGRQIGELEGRYSKLKEQRAEYEGTRKQAKASGDKETVKAADHRLAENAREIDPIGDKLAAYRDEYAALEAKLLEP